jgi:hypothetical protein
MTTKSVKDLEIGNKIKLWSGKIVTVLDLIPARICPGKFLIKTSDRLIVTHRAAHWNCV